MQIDALKTEIDRNFDAFQRGLVRWLSDHQGQYALLRQGEVVSFHDRPGDADRIGAANFPDGLYSIQLVTDVPVDLGLYAAAVR